MLDYGTYYIRFNASMLDVENGNIIPETTASLNGYFFIQPCQLVAKIQGGNGKAVGFEGNLNIFS